MERLSSIGKLEWYRNKILAQVHEEKPRVYVCMTGCRAYGAAELRAALEALRALKEPCRVSLHTDSAYLVRAFNEGWLDNWQRKGWRTASKKPVENKDLWEGLLEQAARHHITWIKVKGHADDPLNNRVDELAVEAMNRGRWERV